MIRGGVDIDRGLVAHDAVTRSANSEIAEDASVFLGMRTFERGATGCQVSASVEIDKAVGTEPLIRAAECVFPGAKSP